MFEEDIWDRSESGKECLEEMGQVDIQIHFE